MSETLRQINEIVRQRGHSPGAFERLRRDCPLPVFIAAARARTGQMRLLAQLTQQAHTG